MLCDDASAGSDSGFYDSVKRLMRALFPTRSLTPIPTDHSIYRSFFLIQRPMGRLDRYAYLEGVTVGNLTPVVVCRNDLSARDQMSGLHTFPCVPAENASEETL